MELIDSAEHIEFLRGKSPEEIRAIWERYASIVPALDLLAAQGLIKPKPEGVSWWNTLIVLTEKGKTVGHEGS